MKINKVILKAVELLKAMNYFISEEAVNEGLCSEVPGRFQRIAEKLFYDGAHNPIGIQKSIYTLVKSIPEDDNRNIIIIWGFTRPKNLVENINNILNHEHADRINNIILIESQPGEPEMINYQPDCIEVKELIHTLKDVHDPKLKVLTEKGSRREIKDIDLVLKEKEIDHICGELSQVVRFVQETQEFEESYIFILGTFRLYREVYQLNHE